MCARACDFVHVCLRSYICMRLCVYVCARARLYVNICMCLCVRAFVCLCVHASVCVCVLVFATPSTHQHAAPGVARPQAAVHACRSPYGACSGCVHAQAGGGKARGLAHHGRHARAQAEAARCR